MTRILSILPLTKSTFTPFGDIIETDPSSMRLINSGTTERYHALAKAEAYGDDARVILNIFRGQARAFPYSVTMMERHPFGSQSFSPLSPKPFLVVVSEDESGKPGEPKVFLAKGGQGVNYRANVWHHPLMSLDETSDFLVVDREGPGNNLEEYFFDEPYLIQEPLL
jgi:ureidoglycolate lyase